ncbi:MAG: PilZ domain-containing protein [Candidatus Acidiferrales bacterium]
MPEAQTNDQRRSSRVFTRIPVRASGKAIDGRKFRENSQTIVINAHGGLLYLHETLELGSEIILTNPATEEEQDCRVVYVGDTSEKGTRVGVEFLSPSPHFWGVEFAPQDWPARPSSRPVY